MDQKTYPVTVVNGYGTAEYTENQSVFVRGIAPSENMGFIGWEGSEELTITQGNSQTEAIIFTMPAEAVTLTAVYKETRTILWLNDDDSELDRKTYYEGEFEPTTDLIRFRKDPKATWVFAYWDEGITDGAVTTYRPIFVKAVFDPTDPASPGIALIPYNNNSWKVVLCPVDSEKQVLYTTDGAISVLDTMQVYESPLILTDTTLLQYRTEDSGVTTVKICVPTKSELNSAQVSQVGEAVLFIEDGKTLDSLTDIVSEKTIRVSLHGIPSQPKEENSFALLLIAFYEPDGKLIGVETRELEFTSMGILYIGEFTLPLNTVIGRVSLFTVDAEYKPCMCPFNVS